MDALATHKEGEIILSGKTSLGFTGFENQPGIAMPGNFIFIGIFDSETGFQTVFGIVVVV